MSIVTFAMVLVSPHFTILDNHILTTLLDLISQYVYIGNEAIFFRILLL